MDLWLVFCIGFVFEFSRRTVPVSLYLLKELLLYVQNKLNKYIETLDIEETDAMKKIKQCIEDLKNND